MASEMEHRNSVVRKANDYLFEKYLLRRMKGALPISELLKENFQKIAPGKPILKIPTICDFEKFNVPKKNIEEEYFLFCGAVEYREIIDFILQAFKLLDESLNIKLYLIASKGTPQQYLDLNQYLKDNHLLQKTKIFSNIPYSELVDLYVNASALLIPLRPTKQDAARFPHKIAEYSATGNPILTTNYGEVTHYFKDGENALIADSYDISKFAEKMKFVIKYPETAKKIGQKGKKLGTEEFSHIQYGQRLKDYLQNAVLIKQQ
jgi:glycosyltransferase involved in cell wall biosynthesis